MDEDTKQHYFIRIQFVSNYHFLQRKHNISVFRSLNCVVVGGVEPHSVC